MGKTRWVPFPKWSGGSQNMAAAPDRLKSCSVELVAKPDRISTIQNQGWEERLL